MRPDGQGKVLLLQISFVVLLLACWELLSRSGLIFQDVVPSLRTLAAALFDLVSDLGFYRHLRVTLYEIVVSVLIGGISGVAVGIVLGANRLLSRIYEPFLYYLGPTPKVVFFPVLIMAFGIGTGSKIAMGSLSCFFPIALSAAAGMRGIDRVLIRVGRSFNASSFDMMRKIYLPAMRVPLFNGFRLGIALAIVGVLLAETKLSNQGLGFMIMSSYARFDLPSMYAILIVMFIVAGTSDAILSRIVFSQKS